MLAAVSRLLYFPFLLPLAWLSPGSITAVCFVVKLILFYYHERVWHQIPFGKDP